MEKRIVRPDGTEYMTVAVTEDSLEFRNFSRHGMTIRMDIKVLDQLAPFLNEATFWRKVTHD